MADEEFQRSVPTDQTEDPKKDPKEDLKDDLAENLKEDNDNEELAPTVADAKKTPPLPGDVPSRRSKQFRQTLLSRVYRLPNPEWDSDNMLDVHNDLKGIVDLNADEFLTPLSRIVEHPNE